MTEGESRGKPTAGEEPAEVIVLREIADRVGTPIADEVWIGDDPAVIDVRNIGSLLFASDLVVEGVHFDRSISSLEDVGWKTMAVNVSDMAAMGGTPLRAVVSVAGASAADLEVLYDGLLGAAAQYGCAIVGGDLSTGSALVVSVAMIGSTGDQSAVLRSGARPGDAIFVTGPLGASAAGLRLLRADPDPDRLADDALVRSHRRPTARLIEGRTAVASGATAMIDVSDGLGIDLHRLADASGVGFLLEDVPVADGAILEEAISGGEDYELIFTARDRGVVFATFATAGVAEPVCIGAIVADEHSRRLRDAPFPRRGYTHEIG